MNVGGIDTFDTAAPKALCPAVIQLDTSLVAIGGQSQHHTSTSDRMGKDRHAHMIVRFLLLALDRFVPVRSKQPMDDKRIFLFTNDDDPLRGDEDEQKKVNIVAKVPPKYLHSSLRSILHIYNCCLEPRRSDQIMPRAISITNRVVGTRSSKDVS